MNTHSFTRAVGILASLFTLATAGAREKKASPDAGEYRPTIDPAKFTHVVTHSYFPLVPGTTYTFLEKEGREERENKVEVTHETKVVMGVKCAVVHDTVSVGGVVKEDTFDWYAQDEQGAVWYFGEATKEFKSGGRVSTAGSWEAGVGAAQPGIVMPAHPKHGAPYRQEYAPKHAEDMGQIVALDAKTTVPAGTYTGCVKTKDWSLLESGHEHKWYAKGVGIVRAESSDGEVSTLVSAKKK